MISIGAYLSLLFCLCGLTFFLWKANEVNMKLHAENEKLKDTIKLLNTYIKKMLEESKDGKTN